MRICSNIHRILYKNMLEIMRKSWKIDPKSVQNPSKIDKIRPSGHSRHQPSATQASGEIPSKIFKAFSHQVEPLN